jgi:rubredoxin
MTQYICPECGKTEFSQNWKKVESSDWFSVDEDGDDIHFSCIEDSYENAHIENISCECGYVFFNENGIPVTDAFDLIKWFQSPYRILLRKFDKIL